MNENTIRILHNLGVNFSHNYDCDFLCIEINEVKNSISIKFKTNILLEVQDYDLLFQKILAIYDNKLSKLSIKLVLRDEGASVTPELIKEYIRYLSKNKIINDENVDLLEIAINEDIVIIEKENNKLNFQQKYFIEQSLNLLLGINKKIVFPYQMKKVTEKPTSFNSRPTNLGKINDSEIISIEEAKDDLLPANTAAFKGLVYGTELRVVSSKKTKKEYTILSFYVFDGNDAIKCSCFASAKMPINELKKVHDNMIIKVKGTVKDDKYMYGQKSCDVQDFIIVEEEAPFTTREDLEEEKRVELHLHTNLTTLSGISKVDDYAKLIKHFGHKAMAITDKDIVQSFVHGDRIHKNYGLKMLYGVEANVFQFPKIIENPISKNLKEARYCIFDTETTGLSANFNDLIEIGAVILENGQIIDRFQTFVKINKPLSSFITKLTSITDADLAQGVELKQALVDFLQWSEGCIYVAHNATFDRQVIARNMERVLGKYFELPIIDTLELSRFLNVDRKYHSLSILSKIYKVPIDENAHHRADYDAEQLALIFFQMLEQLEENNIENLNQLNDAIEQARNRGKNNLIFVRNQKGLSNFYQLISDSLTKDFMLNPRVDENNIIKFRNDLIYIGGADIDGEIIDAYLNKNQNEQEAIFNKFDYIEILPKDQYLPLIKNGTFEKEQDIEDMIKYIINLANSLNKKVIANGNVYFTEPFLAKAKEIVISSSYGNYAIEKDYSVDKKYIKDCEKFRNWRETNSKSIEKQYYRTTKEMLEAFDFLENPKEIVIDNPNYLADEIEEIKIIPDDLYTPNIEGVDEKVRDLVYSNAKRIYGENLPSLISERIEKELKSIIRHGYAIIYYISYKLVKYSNDHGYLVGSRGSVGSSVVAFFMGISEVNPLIPHYVCPNCHEIEFFENGEVSSGFDLDDKKCKNCQTDMNHDGQNIPFETFLGFDGDKVPDIDLNFSGEFQANAHEFVRSKDKLNDDELFDFDHAFRAGTIKTLAEKTAFNAVKSYYRLLGKPVDEAVAKFYSLYCVGAKQSTGQHPGGIIVIPQNMSVYDFTPIQYPANKQESAWRTTHFDFNAIHDNVLKLDILGHDDPTMLKHLRDLTGIDPVTIDVTDKKVLDLFVTNTSLNFVKSVDLDLGSLGLPEFGTETAMRLLRKAKPKSFADLVQVSGLSHGTGIWAGNAEDLIDSGQCNISEVIGCRDDIMSYLSLKGLPNSDAFNIMEHVRKGKGLTDDEVTLMQQHNVPEWYILSCKKIEYMFPKAHACAYVLMALRIGWYKVYEPVAYYCAYFSSRIKKFSVHSMIKGYDQIIAEYKQLSSDLKKNVEDRLGKMSNEMIEEKMKCLNMAKEMTGRGFKFYNVDLNLSDSTKFKIHPNGDGIIIPFQAIDNLGEKEALSIIAAREEKPFTSIEDFKKRTKVKKNSFEELTLLEVFSDLKESDE